MNNNLVKCGTLHKFSKGFMGEKWKRVYCTLYRDGSFFWFKNKGDPTSRGNVSLKNVCKFLTVGANIRAIPYNPDLPSWANIDHVIAFPQEPSKKSKVYFFLTESVEDMTSWMKSINEVLPPPPQPSGGIAPNCGAPQYPYSAPPSYAPPVYGAPGAPPQSHPMPSAPPPGAPPLGAGAPPGPGLGFDSVAMPQPGPGYTPYPTQPPTGGAYQPPPPNPYITQPPAGAAYQPPPPNPYTTQPPAGAAYQHPSNPYPAHPPAGYGPPPPGHCSGAPPPQGYQPYPQQQPAYQQNYPQQNYPTQQYAAYPQQQGYGAPRQGYAQPAVYGQPAAQTVYVKDKKSKNKGYKKMALGLAGGAVAGYAASRLISPFGGGWGSGSWGSGSWGSGSFGSCGSFGSFG